MCLETGGAGPQTCRRGEGFQSDVLAGLFQQMKADRDGFLTKSELVGKSNHVHHSCSLPVPQSLQERQVK